MMAYDMQLKDFTTVYDKETTSRRHEEVLPHVNSYEFSLHFLASNKQRAA